MFFFIFFALAFGKNFDRYLFAKVGAGLGLGLRFFRLPGIIKLSEI